MSSLRRTCNIIVVTQILEQDDPPRLKALILPSYLMLECHCRFRCSACLPFALAVPIHWLQPAMRAVSPGTGLESTGVLGGSFDRSLFSPQPKTKERYNGTWKAISSKIHLTIHE